MTEQSETPLVDAAVDSIMVDVNDGELGLAGALARLSVVSKKLERTAAKLREENAELVRERDKHWRRLQAMLPLFQEARDALPAISLVSAKLRGLDLTLGDRMDEVGVPELWRARCEREDALSAAKGEGE
jgi:hypothetical protein